MKSVNILSSTIQLQVFLRGKPGDFTENTISGSIERTFDFVKLHLNVLLLFFFFLYFLL